MYGHMEIQQNDREAPPADAFPRLDAEESQGRG